MTDQGITVMEDITQVRQDIITMIVTEIPSQILHQDTDPDLHVIRVAAPGILTTDIIMTKRDLRMMLSRFQEPEIKELLLRSFLQDPNISDL